MEKRAREERMEMVANAERMDREQEERAKAQIGDALVSPKRGLLYEGGGADYFR